MAFGKKKNVDQSVTQDTVALKAAEALKNRRKAGLTIAFRATFLDPGVLMHRFGQKAVCELVGKMVGQPVPRGRKDLTAEFEESIYRNAAGEIVIPCRIIKAAIIEGAIATDGVVTKADLKRNLRVLGLTSPVIGPDGQRFQTPTMDCRIAQNFGTVDMRSRALVPGGCYVDFAVQFNPTLHPDQVVSALEGAGACIGLCDNRPERGGEFGTFEIEVLTEPNAIEDTLEACKHAELMYEIPVEMRRAFNAAVEDNPTAKNGAAGKVGALLNDDAKREQAGNEVNGFSPPSPRSRRREVIQVD